MNVDVPTLSLCAGSGMLDTAAELALHQFGLRARPLVYVERDSAAAAVLVARMEAQTLGEAPVWDELETFDGRPFRPYMARGILLASLPCQPYSLAGKRLGNKDHRSHGEDGEGPIVHFLRIVAECRPALVFLENVSAWVVGGHFRSVGEELCRLGYEIEDPIFLAASDVGAPHERERVFILAHLNGSGCHGDAEQHGGSLKHQPECTDRGHALRRGLQLALSPRRGLRAGGEPSERDGLADGGNQQLADADGGGRRQQGDCGVEDRVDPIDGDMADALQPRSEGTGSTQPRRGAGVGNVGNQLGDSERADARAGDVGEQGDEAEQRRGGFADAGHHIPLFPPGRGDPDDPDHPDWWAWAAVAAVDATRMPRTQSPIPMVVDGMASSDLLRIGGNGVVPQCAALALAVLLRRVVPEIVGAGGELAGGRR